MPEELWTEVHDSVQEAVIKTISKKKKWKKAKWLSKEALQIAEKRKEAKGKEEKKRYTHLNAPPPSFPVDVIAPGPGAGEVGAPGGRAGGRRQGGAASARVRQSVGWAGPIQQCSQRYRALKMSIRFFL